MRRRKSARVASRRLVSLVLFDREFELTDFVPTGAVDAFQAGFSLSSDSDELAEFH